MSGRFSFQNVLVMQTNLVNANNTTSLPSHDLPVIAPFKAGHKISAVVSEIPSRLLACSFVASAIAREAACFKFQRWESKNSWIDVTVLERESPKALCRPTKFSQEFWYTSFTETALSCIATKTKGNIMFGMSPSWTRSAACFEIDSMIAPDINLSRSESDVW